MADEKLSDVDNQVCIGGPNDPVDHRAAEAITPCMALTAASTDGSVKPANGGVADENFYGVAGVPEWDAPDIDAEVAVDSPVPVHKKGSGAECWMFLAPAAGPIPVEEGDILILSSTDGYVEKGDESSAAAKAGQVVGVCRKGSPGHATDRKMILVKI